MADYGKTWAFDLFSNGAAVVKATPQQRMRWAYKEGTAAMLVTLLGIDSTDTFGRSYLPAWATSCLRTVTTCGSFYANCFSIVTVVRTRRTLFVRRTLNMLQTALDNAILHWLGKSTRQCSS